jgi:type I restriction enzyme S subunit
MILKDICVVDWGNTELTKSSYIENGRFLAVSAAGCDGKIDHYEHESDVSVLSAIGAQCGKMFFPNTKFTAIKNTITLKPKENVLGKYIFYLFTSINLPKRGTGQPFISKGDIEKFIIPQIPPLPIQQKIVAKLDKIFAEIDKAIAAAEKNVKNSKALYENYLRDVFKKNRNSWNNKYLNEISQNLDNKRRPIKKRIRENGTIPYYGASGVIDYVKDFIFDEDILLISEDGANLLARTYPIVFSVSGKCWVNNHAHVIKFNNIIYQKFVEFYLNSISLKPFISGMAQPKLNQAKLNKIPIPFPSLDQQTKLVTAFNSIKEITNNLNKIYFKKVDEFIFLKQSILQQAFNGELVKAA